MIYLLYINVQVFSLKTRQEFQKGSHVYSSTVLRENTKSRYELVGSLRAERLHLIEMFSFYDLCKDDLDSLQPIPYFFCSVVLNLFLFFLFQQIFLQCDLSSVASFTLLGATTGFTKMSFFFFSFCASAKSHTFKEH